MTAFEWKVPRHVCLQMFTIYRATFGPSGSFVAIRVEVRPNVEVPVCCEARPAATLELARALVSEGRVRIPRDVDDPPNVVETWL